MSETSGFFDAQLIDGEYDRVYYAEQFANYFKRLVGNGVFASPVNQLKVSVGNGMNVLVGSGNAFINGYWYNNSESKALTINPNTGNRDRIDSIKLRYSNALRSISVNVYEGTTDVIQTEGRYELKLAEITVKPLTAEITANDIKDTRMNESVCGFVKGLVEIVNTEDLFSQYDAIFNEWFDTAKEEMSELGFLEVKQDVSDIKDGSLVVGEAAKASNDFILINKEILSFSDKICTISDERITADSLADVYFTSDTFEAAKKADVMVDTISGKVVLTAARVPDNVIKATIRVRVI